MAVIVIDPGHGGTAKVGGSSPNNAMGPAGTLEKWLTLDLAQRVEKILRDAAHSVSLTRDSDTNLSLIARAAVGIERRADVFVSIHFNASEDHTAQGTETLIDVRHTAGSDRLASCIQGKVQSVVGARDRGVKLRDDLGVLDPANHLATTAVTLVEVSFLDRADEEARLLDDQYRQRIAQAIADAAEMFVTSPQNWGEPVYKPHPAFWVRFRALFPRRGIAGDI